MNKSLSAGTKRLQGVRMVVVEDDAMLVERLTDLFKGEGATIVRVCNTVEGAVSALQENLDDSCIVTLDTMLPNTEEDCLAINKHLDTLREFSSNLRDPSVSDPEKKSIREKRQIVLTMVNRLINRLGGLEIATELAKHASNKHFAVLILTAVNEDAIREECLTLFKDRVPVRWLVKPVDSNTLIETTMDLARETTKATTHENG